MITRSWADKRARLKWLSIGVFAILLLSLLSHTSRHHGRGNAEPPSPESFADSKLSNSTDTSKDLSITSPEVEPPVIALTDETLPSTGSGAPQIHIVIAQYSEDPYYIKTWTDNLRTMPYMQKLGIKVILYTKQSSTDLTALKQISGAEEVLRLPNVGREGGTYLHHILSVYDNPPQYILFAQAYLKKAQQETGEHMGQLKGWLDDRLRNKFNESIGFMSLDRKHNICYCGHCTDMGRTSFYPLWPQIYAMLENEVCQELDGNLLSFNGHFIVSRKRLLARPQRIYKYLQELVDAPQDHWIHSEPEPKWFEKEKGKSVPSNPKFGHTLERLWHQIFSCSNPADTVHCDAVGMKAEGPGGCSCKDLP